MSVDARGEFAPRFRPPPAVTLLVPTVVAFLIEVLGTAAISVWQRVPASSAFLSILLAAAAALALLGARRWPGPTVAVVAALTAANLFVPPDASPPYIALAFAIIGAIVRGARVWASVSVAATWLIAIVGAGVLEIGVPPFRVALVTIALALCFGIGEGIRRRLEHAETSRAQVHARRQAIEQEERSRVARELHDVLAHSLSQIAVQSGVGLHLFDREPERAREALASIRALSATGLDEVRGVLAFLRGTELGTQTAPLTPQPQLAQLGALAAERSGLGLTVDLDDRLEGDVPASAVQTTAYRIAQEALTNVVRHSGGSRASVTVERMREGQDDLLVVTVADDGVGRAASSGDGAGIRGMRERAELAGGTVTVEQGERDGTVVIARLPWAGPR
ncbi:sensor histidine kinase [Microbacterium terricola]|uniref:histidine kinase n=1 Tax=Microbacterium terricola TaxID=344163 RepID=A0ABM8DXS8_9MICO|nr:sensor histidine kinase [Microbacterium terricola]UYK38870.1 sensor histidine kinase [Microbacterium terricola]BDV30434.1 two-component sensor histidine kinase [Microbacterium terricola]